MSEKRSGNEQEMSKEFMPRGELLKALDALPETCYIPVLYGLLNSLEVVKAAGIWDPPQEALWQAIVDEMNRLDKTPARGTPERP